MSKATNWIFGAIALFILTKVFGNDEPASVSPPAAIPPQETIRATEQAPQPLGFMQAKTHDRQTSRRRRRLASTQSLENGFIRPPK
ncbi:hypothetical protein [Brucella tritici]|uniref:hypothetical protein n=1 Tax=Brucella tritici TaxID=94626 RepID=UPI001F22FD86|nr:hypothetical protein [Brucella tritici]